MSTTDILPRCSTCGKQINSYSIIDDRKYCLDYKCMPKLVEVDATPIAKIATILQVFSDSNEMMREIVEIMVAQARRYDAEINDQIIDLKERVAKLEAQVK